MIECIRYTKINRGTCLGLATIFIPKWGVELSGIALHMKNGKRWVNLPAREVSEPIEVSPEHPDGIKKKYYQYMRFPKRDHKDKFCDLIKQAIDAHSKATAEQETTTEDDDPIF